MRLKLKKIIPIAILSLTALTVTPIASANNQACAMVICLSSSEAGEACTAAKKQFFKILVKKHKKIRVGKTIRKRFKKLEQCEGSEAKDREKIMAKYGARTH